MKQRAPRFVVSVVVGLISTCFLTSSALAGQGYPFRATDHPSGLQVGRDHYSFETIDPPFGEPGVDLIVQLLWTNNSGIVICQYQMPPVPEFDNLHTAVLRHGVWSIIDVPDAANTGGTNANNHGQVVLSYQFADEIWHAAIYGRRGLEPFPDLPDYPGGIVAQGINERGQLAAVVIDIDGSFHGLVGTAEEHIIFDYPDPEVAATIPFGLNNQGVVVGGYDLSDGSHAFRLEEGDFANIDRPGGTGSFATSINNKGVIVAAYVDAAGASVGYLLDKHGEYTDFMVPGATFTVPFFINDRGQISGVYGDSDGIAHGFVATPDGK